MWKFILFVILVLLAVLITIVVLQREVAGGAVGPGHRWINVYRGCNVDNKEYDRLLNLWMKKSGFKSAKKSKNPTAICIGGAPGSGKSTLLYKLAKKNPGYVRMEEDDVIDNLPLYKEGIDIPDINGKKTGVGSTQVFMNCDSLYGEMLDYLYEKCLKKKYNFIISDPSVHNAFPELKKAGYRVIYYDIWEDAAPERHRKRELATGKFISVNRKRFADLYEFGGLFADEIHLIYNGKEKTFTREKYIEYMKKYFS